MKKKRKEGKERNRENGRSVSKCQARTGGVNHQVKKTGEDRRARKEIK